MAINNNVGALSGTDGEISIKGSGSIISTSDTGSILAVKYIKDTTITDTTNLENIDSLGLKNWFAEYVGTLGKFNKDKNDNKDVKFSDYLGATILGFKIQLINETPNGYQNANDAEIFITPINGETGADGKPRSFTVGASGKGTKSSNGSAVSFTQFDAPRVVDVFITDNKTSVTIQVKINLAYDNAGPTILGTDTVGLPGQVFGVSWAGGKNPVVDPSKPVYVFLGKAHPTRPYGINYS